MRGLQKFTDTQHASAVTDLATSGLVGLGIVSTIRKKTMQRAAANGGTVVIPNSKKACMYA